MGKIHTKAKRAKGLRNTHLKHKFWFTTVTKKKGPKSFKTKEAAEAWATKTKLDTKTHTLYALKKKFQWRAV
ncbi:MAG: hypothetical protein OXR66_09680 [Candidatus Woesearchaeota archaeon]|nr:hypothetical protein [Candidatus Woesearchaeota archaeon]